MIEDEIKEQKAIEVSDVFINQSKNKLNKSALAGIIYLICCFLFVGVKILNAYGILYFTNNVVEEIVSSSIVQIVIMFSIPVVLFTLLSKQGFKQTFKDFSFKKIKPISILYSIIIGVCACILINFISSFFQTIITSLGAENITKQSFDPSNFSVGMFFVVILTSCIMPAICEEVAHRGMILGAYKKYGVIFAIVISGILFGLLHMNIYQCFYACAIGIFLGYLCVYTKSIIPCIIIHFVNNFLNTLWDFCYVNDWLGGGLYVWKAWIMNNLGMDIYYFFNIIITFVALMLLVYLSYKLIKKERLNDILEDVPENVKEQYEFAKQNPALLMLVKKSYVAPNEKDYYYQWLKKRAKEKKVTLLQYLESGGEKSKHKWYDNIFIYTAIVLASFYTLYSFFFLVV